MADIVNSDTGKWVSSLLFSDKIKASLRQRMKRMKAIDAYEVSRQCLRLHDASSCTATLAKVRAGKCVPRIFGRVCRRSCSLMFGRTTGISSSSRTKSTTNTTTTATTMRSFQSPAAGGVASLQGGVSAGVGGVGGA